MNEDNWKCDSFYIINEINEDNCGHHHLLINDHYTYRDKWKWKYLQFNIMGEWVYKTCLLLLANSEHLGGSDVCTLFGGSMFWTRTLTTNKVHHQNKSQAC